MPSTQLDKVTASTLGLARRASEAMVLPLARYAARIPMEPLASPIIRMTFWRASPVLVPLPPSVYDPIATATASTVLYPVQFVLPPIAPGHLPCLPRRPDPVTVVCHHAGGLWQCSVSRPGATTCWVRVPDGPLPISFLHEGDVLLAFWIYITFPPACSPMGVARHRLGCREECTVGRSWDGALPHFVGRTGKGWSTVCLMLCLRLFFSADEAGEARTVVKWAKVCFSVRVALG